MRRLIVANTFYQVIFATQMRMTKFKNEDIALVITDHSKSAEVVAKRLGEQNIFGGVYYVKTLGISGNRSISQRLIDLIEVSFLNKNRYICYVEQISDLDFDEIIVFNYDIGVYGFFSILSKVNPNLKLSRYEEGILSYSNEIVFTPVRRMISLFRKVQGKATVEKALSNYYCFYPQLYRGGLNPCAVPLIRLGDNIGGILRKTFNINVKEISYPQKYLFFTSVYDFEGGNPIGEYELVCRIAELVGKNNLLIKTHPRDRRTVYTDNGFIVDRNASVPWEAIQLSGDFSDKVFLTVNSGSVLSGSTMSAKPVKTCYMYRLCDISENESCKKSVSDIERLLADETMKDILKNVKIADRLEDIL